MMNFIFSIIFACQTNYLIDNLSDFTNSWWQIYLSNTPYGSCYYFNSDGLLIEKTKEGTRPIGQWEYREVGNSYTVIAADKSIELLAYEAGCWKFEYEFQNFWACSCQI